MPQNVTRKHKPEPAGRRGTYWSENGALPVPDVVADTTGLHGGSLGLKRVNQISKGSADRLVGKINRHENFERNQRPSQGEQSWDQSWVSKDPVTNSLDDGSMTDTCPLHEGARASPSTVSKLEEGKQTPIDLPLSWPPGAL